VLLGGLATTVVALGGFGLWTALDGAEIPGPDRMAILPIRDASGADGELVTAMYDQLIVHLGQLPGVTVAPSSAMEVYRTQPRPAAEIAEELRVGALLEGNVFRSGERLRITLQLTDPRSIEQIWSDSFELDTSGDLFDAIDGVLPQIAEGVQRAVDAHLNRS
jgi:TolB-like protein